MSKQTEFEQGVRAFKADLYRYAYGLSRDRFVAEDLLQETFARAWKSWDALKNEPSRKFWLMSILRHENARRFAKNTPEMLPEDEEVLELPAPPQPASYFELENLVHHLPTSLREPLLLQVLGGFSCAEIADLMHTTEGAVMTRLTRARQAMRTVLCPHHQPLRKTSP